MRLRDQEVCFGDTAEKRPLKKLRVPSSGYEQRAQLSTAWRSRV